jgi:hypothetical protein
MLFSDLQNSIRHAIQEEVKMPSLSGASSIRRSGGHQNAHANSGIPSETVQPNLNERLESGKVVAD